MFIKKIKKYILYRLHILFSDVYLFISHFHALCNTVSIISPVCRDRSSKRFDIPKTHPAVVYPATGLECDTSHILTHMTCSPIWGKSDNTSLWLVFFFITEFYLWRAKAFFLSDIILSCVIFHYHQWR